MNYSVYENLRLSREQRLGTVAETLVVFFSIPDGQKATDLVSEFQQFEIGSTWTLKMNAVGGVMSVEK